MRSSELATNRRRRSVEPLYNNCQPIKIKIKARSIRDCSELDKKRPGLHRWAEGPYVILIEGVGSSLCK
jgi:hypothetical protein